MLLIKARPFGGIHISGKSLSKLSALGLSAAFLSVAFMSATNSTFGLRTFGRIPATRASGSDDTNMSRLVTPRILSVSRINPLKFSEK